jgi:Ni,Fe-hydrogenase I small subunit
LKAEAIIDETIEKYDGNFILAVEGNTPLNQDGMSCIMTSIKMWTTITLVMNALRIKHFRATLSI